MPIDEEYGSWEGPLKPSTEWHLGGGINSVGIAGDAAPAASRQEAACHICNLCSRRVRRILLWGKFVEVMAKL